MRALAPAKLFLTSGRQAACSRPLPRNLVLLRQRHSPALRPGPSVQAAASTNANGSSSSSRSSSSASSSNGWLLDSASSLDSSSSSSSRYDAIMMLGGGLLPNGGLPEWVVRRLDGCLHLYQQQLAAAATDGGSIPPAGATQLEQQGRLWRQQFSGGGCPIVLLGAGTPHKPPVIDAGGYVVHESTAYAAYLMQRGVPAADLFKEAQSYDTVGNGYFSLLQHAVPAGWRRIAVVTSEFHMPRTAATFDFIYRLAGQELHADPDWFTLDFRPVSDEGIFDPEVLAVRAEKEAAAVATWRRNTGPMRSLADLHAWLYATHLCYSVSRQHEFGHEKGLDPKLAATY